MILGLGIDLLDIRRMERELARGPWLAGDGVFTAREIRRCNASPRPALRFAQFFAVKEATLKALALDLADPSLLREVEVRALDRCRCRVRLRARLEARRERLGARRTWVLLTGARRHAGALVIFEN